MQLERILHSQGFGSRKICRSMIRHGEVTVNGEVCDFPFSEFDPENLNFTVRGEAWQFRAQAYLMLNKPAHYECSHKPQHHPSIFSLLPAPLLERGVQSIGRLDEDTTGLLLLSDDGQFIHRMSSPKWKVPKVYEVTTKHPLDETQIASLLSGVQLLDEPAPVAALAAEVVGGHVLHLTLAEGKYHQVKRMLAAVSNRVEALKRIRIGGLALPDDLAPGEWRWLDADMLESVSPVRQA
ncbi:16S rRNA pseudouridine(516) synthase [Methylobacillus flagellatus]|uniref:pseudouridine synthase n=1 Tax=Methylobacillus flagellatus TaxID=405 RepID=UPI002853D7A7|nr:16S rRNA pseudouridine(516) synthase [Methylobacillus flagellatus]MDR5171046.1 16S rRNA pseudouridine(516) synthase [Methylobacillus flagellatus]